MADAALRSILHDADQGTLAGLRRTGATFEEAALEYLRYVEQDRERDRVTV
jgi:hypothetical protein